MKSVTGLLAFPGVAQVDLFGGFDREARGGNGCTRLEAGAALKDPAVTARRGSGSCPPGRIRRAGVTSRDGHRRSSGRLDRSAGDRQPGRQCYYPRAGCRNAGYATSASPRSIGSMANVAFALASANRWREYRGSIAGHSARNRAGNYRYPQILIVAVSQLRQFHQRSIANVARFVVWRPPGDPGVALLSPALAEHPDHFARHPDLRHARWC